MDLSFDRFFISWKKNNLIYNEYRRTVENF